MIYYIKEINDRVYFHSNSKTKASEILEIQIIMSLAGC